MTDKEVFKVEELLEVIGRAKILSSKDLELLCKTIKEFKELEKENAILKKALNLYVDWADECGVAWDNFPDMKEKWWKIVEEKGLGWIEGLTFMAMEEAKEQFLKEADE